jgi:hypothetical protein
MSSLPNRSHKKTMGSFRPARLRPRGNPPCPRRLEGAKETPERMAGRYARVVHGVFTARVGGDGASGFDGFGLHCIVEATCAAFED